MLWNLEPSWLMMAVASVIVMALFFGSALHAIMRDDGFGPIGNMVLFTAGFFIAILVANSWGIHLRDLTRAVATGLGGAFVIIATLAILKGVLVRS
jgi:uncharacterized membrane protein YeaQ/YmgE (transglycosylase-associated protein family)